MMSGKLICSDYYCLVLHCGNDQFLPRSRYIRIECVFSGEMAFSWWISVTKQWTTPHFWGLRRGLFFRKLGFSMILNWMHGDAHKYVVLVIFFNSDVQK